MTETFDQLAEKAWTEGHIPELQRLEEEMIYRLLRREIRAVGHEPTLLDVGCGAGEALGRVKVPPSRYIGVDKSQPMLNQAIKRNRTFARRFFEGDATDIVVERDLPWKPDLIMSVLGAFDYMEPMLSLRWASYTLESEGSLFVAFRGPKHRWLRFEDTLGEDPNAFDDPEVLRELAQNNFPNGEVRLQAVGSSSLNERAIAKQKIGRFRFWKEQIGLPLEEARIIVLTVRGHR